VLELLGRLGEVDPVAGSGLVVGPGTFPEERELGHGPATVRTVTALPDAVVSAPRHARTAGQSSKGRRALSGNVRPWRAYLSLVVTIAGIALLVDAVLRGTAQASIVLIVPVLSGSSPEFLIGTLLTFVGLVSLFLSWGSVEMFDAADGAEGSAPRSGGVVLIGPVPIFFGEWKQMGRRGVWGWVAAGTIATAVLVLLFVWIWVRG